MGRDAREIPLAIESLRLWRGMNQQIGRDTGFRQAGIVYLCQNEKEIAAQERWLTEARQYQVDARILRGAAIDASSLFVGVMHTPTDGRAEPSQSAPAIAEAARASGATILTYCAVRGIETRGGRVSGVVT
jgi:glycine/D-amino acid oxidase-like deaminating enzyme